MIDSLLPGLEALKAATNDGTNLAEALEKATVAAEQGMKDTIPLVAKKGRASYLGERSAGHQDPGATSSYFLLKTACWSISASCWSPFLQKNPLISLILLVIL